jgi:hypothetical protein
MSKPATAAAPSALIDRRIAELGDWRGQVLGRVRQLIHEAVPGVVEEWKWENPVWSHGGILCTGETYKAKVKLTFPKGALLNDPRKVFNASLEGNARRAVDIAEGEELDADAFKALVCAAAELNQARAKPARAT